MRDDSVRGAAEPSGRTTPSTGSATVFIIDDDDNVRRAIAGLLKSVGLRSEAYGTAQEFLGRRLPEGPSCLVLDVRLPGMNGPEVQRELVSAGVSAPVIFITGPWARPAARQAVESG